ASGSNNMIDFESMEFESELKRLKPAAPPRGLLARLGGLRLEKPVRAVSASSKAAGFIARVLSVYWLVPAGAALLIGSCLLFHQFSSTPAPLVQGQAANPPTVANHPIHADQVEIDQKLITAFDAIARLPGDVPVRFHCREWRDEIVLRDSSRGVVIERQAPRLEVVPVRFETY
ncbi:MAG TPA: hypothetical protein VHI52_17445, partial [Verrucomicrobiae bacterium]|nr:hypothetical protein [Verrucomicrobiae bacterium]